MHISHHEFGLQRGCTDSAIAVVSALQHMLSLLYVIARLFVGLSVCPSVRHTGVS